jgi:hypothetical protein
MVYRQVIARVPCQVMEVEPEPRPPRPQLLQIAAAERASRPALDRAAVARRVLDGMGRAM